MHYLHNNGDTIDTHGSVYTITRAGVKIPTDIGKWSYNAERWIDKDIQEGLYPGFVKQTPAEI